MRRRAADRQPSRKLWVFGLIVAAAYLAAPAVIVVALYSDIGRLEQQVIGMGGEPVTASPSAGRDGRDGVGVQGPPGEDGEDGRDGLTIVGPPGAAGEDGAPGVGVAGADGQDGQDGKDGTNGRDGDTVVGPQGPPGETVVGPAGPQGPQGEQGWPGDPVFSFEWTDRLGDTYLCVDVDFDLKYECDLVGA